MTLLADPAAARHAASATQWWERLWRAPVGAHLAALTAVLLLLLPLVGTSSSFLADEGAAVIQAKSLAAGDGWIVPHPAGGLDPTGAYYPLVNAEHGAKGFAPLAKHPAYAVLLAAAVRMGGVTAMVLLSLLGTVVAAGLAAAIGHRFDPALVRPAVWAVGLGSPLLFDGFLVLGHSLGAALVAAAVLLAIVALIERRPRVALGVAPCVAAAVLLRNEALLFAVALALVAAVVAVTRRPVRLPAATVAGSALGAAAVAHLVEGAWVAHIVGGTIGGAGVPVPAAAGGLVRGRVDGFLLTWLGPGYGVSPALGLCLLTMVAALAVAARSSRVAVTARATLVPGAVAAVAAIAAFAVAPTNVVPGLLLAFPLVVPAVVVLRRQQLADAGVLLAAATAAAFALAVLATQYATGGTGEWGGRYFALAIPVAVPVLLLALHRRGQALPALARRGGAGALIVCTLSLSAMAVVSLRANHQQKLQLVAAIERGKAVGGPGAPVVTTWSAAPRFAWSIFDETPWLRVDAGDIGDLREHLASVGVTRFVFVTSNLAADRARLAGLDVVWDEQLTGPGRRIVVVQERELSR